jgi:ribosomal protein S11
VYEAVNNPGALDMSQWHTCNTTHCRAGWVTFLAGEAGAALEKQTSTEFAAMQIYKKSSAIKVSPMRFYENNEVALKDMQRCAEEEQQQAGK